MNINKPLWKAWQTHSDSSDGAQQRCCIELRVQESSCCGKQILLTVPWQPWNPTFTQYDREYFKNLRCSKITQRHKDVFFRIVFCACWEIWKSCQRGSSEQHLITNLMCTKTCSDHVTVRSSKNILNKNNRITTNHHVKVNTSSRLFLLQCTVRQLCAGELCGEMWHNSDVNHQAQSLTAVYWWFLPLHSKGAAG